MLSNNKIIFESIRYYIGTGKFKGELKKWNIHLQSRNLLLNQGKSKF
jgi:hypothetical protein